MVKCDSNHGWGSLRETNTMNVALEVDDNLAILLHVILVSASYTSAHALHILKVMLDPFAPTQVDMLMKFLPTVIHTGGR